MKRLVTLLILFVTACGADHEIRETATVDVPADVGKADAGRWKTRAAETSVWFDTRVQTVEHGWLITGRISRTILSITAQLDDGHFVRALSKTPRTFEVTIEEAGLQKLSAGHRLFVTFETERGDVTGMARYLPRLSGFSGDSDLFVFNAMLPARIGSDVALRGRVRIPSGYSLEVATTDIGIEGTVGLDPELWLFDFPLETVGSLLDAPILLHATDVESQSLIKEAQLTLKLAQIGVSDELPSEAWAKPECLPHVKECLAKLSPRDMEVCGYFEDVEACLAPFAGVFTRDLKNAIAAYYEEHADEIREFEGRTLDSALRHVSPHAVNAVIREEYGDFADLNPAAVVWHPGVTFRDSAQIWYGAYSLQGELLKISIVNDPL